MPIFSLNTRFTLNGDIITLTDFNDPDQQDVKINIKDITNAYFHEDEDKVIIDCKII